MTVPPTLLRAQTYTETYRPQYHFSPAINWMNDPNGMVYYEGEYHLFYQHNPEGIQWGHMNWGHAVSPDMVHWEHLPLALPETDSTMAFSGSAVVDWKSTSGFGTDGKPPLIAIYTAHYPGRGLQNQYIAYSNDRGRTWTPYEGNPVLDIGMADFRDPKVFWYAPEEKWVMVVALSLERKLHFYASQDLKNWTLLSTFGPAGSADGIWECPDLFELPVDNKPGTSRWVLEVDMGSEAIAGGSGGQYFVGHFNGTTFVPEHTDTRWVDYGKDFYAAVSWSDIPAEDGRRLWIGWMNNWLYANNIPTDPWRSAQSIPRVLSLREVQGDLWLIQRPVQELEKLRRTHVHREDITLTDSTHVLEDVRGKTLEIIAKFELGSAHEAGIKVHVGNKEETRIGYNKKRESVQVSRRNSGKIAFHPAFTGERSGPAEMTGGHIKLHIFVDWSSVEVFADDGKTVITEQVFPSPTSDGVQFYARGGTARLVSLDVWELGSIWK